MSNAHGLSVFVIFTHHDQSFPADMDITALIDII